MHTVAKLLGLAVASFLLLVSCSSKPSLDRFFVDHQEQIGFIVQDLPKSLVPMNVEELPAAERAAYESLDKANVLFYRAESGTPAQMNAYYDEVDALLDPEEFTTLMSTEGETWGMNMYYSGDKEDIDSFVILAKDPKIGFTIVRLLGDDMSVGELLKLYQYAETNGVDMSNLIGRLQGMVTGTNAEETVDAD